MSSTESIPSAITMNWASPTSLIREMGGFDDAFRQGEDSDLSYRIFLAGYAIVYAEAAVILHTNPPTFLGLLREGCRHGMASVRLSKKHSSTRRALGVKRADVSTYLGIGRDLLDVLRGADRIRAACSLCFNSGKKVGRVLGSMRFAHLAL